MSISSLVFIAFFFKFNKVYNIFQNKYDLFDTKFHTPIVRETPIKDSINSYMKDFLIIDNY